MLLMPSIELSEETLRRLRAFKRIVKVVLGRDAPETESELAELVILLGLDRMLRDVLPTGDVEDIFHQTMVEMFRQNPEFVSSFVASILERGERIREEQMRNARRRWGMYIQ